MVSGAIAEAPPSPLRANVQVRWRVPEPSLYREWPTRPDGLTDYFALDPARIVKAGQVLATFDRAAIPPLAAGPGIRVSNDGLQYYAGFDGFAQVAGRQLIVHEITVVQGNLGGGDHEFAGSVVIQGDIRAGRILAGRFVAITGLVAGASIQAGEGILVTRAGRSTLRTEGSVYVSATLRHCDVVACRRVIASEGATMIGGCITAGSGLLADVAGAPDGTPTALVIGSNRLNAFRLDELEAEINTCKQNIHKIAQALRMSNLSAHAVRASKKPLIDALAEQRSEMEKRVEMLYTQKRNALLGGYTNGTGVAVVRGTAYQGVRVSIHRASLLLESPRHAVRFDADEESKHVRELPIHGELRGA